MNTKRKKTGRRVLSFLLTLAMVIGLMPGMSLTAYAANISYIDGSGTSQTVEANELASDTTSWTDGSWYIVPEGGLTISGRITANGTVNLILRDGAELTANQGVTTTGATLNIYAQSGGTGILTATAADSNSFSVGAGAGIGGIGGGGFGEIGGAGGTVNIYGGIVKATGGNASDYGGAGAGIGGGGGGYEATGGAGGRVNMYGGTVETTGGNYRHSAGGGAGIGGGGGSDEKAGGAGGTVSIYGGTVKATGGNVGEYGGGCPGIGGGYGGGFMGSAGADGTLTLGPKVKLYEGTDVTGTVLDSGSDSSHDYTGARYNKKNMFATIVHDHSFAYSATGATITATCSAGDCNLTDNKVMLTIVKPTLETYGETGKSAEATLEGLEAFNAATGKAIAATAIRYVGRDGTTYAESQTAPTDEGKYTAKITVEEVTASVNYEIVKANAVPANVTANNRTYDGTEKPLVTVIGETTGGTMQYALGTDATNTPTSGWGTSIPTGTDAKTYYVWYKAVGDGDHTDSEAEVITVTIKEVHTHSIRLVEAKEPTCTEDGYKEHYECSECGAWFGDITGVSEITDKSGYTIKATGHDWGSYEVITRPTYDEEGLKIYTCKNDPSHTKEETIPKLSGSSDSDSDTDNSDGSNMGSRDSRDSSSGKSSSTSADVQSMIDQINTTSSVAVPENHQVETGAAASDVGGNWDHQVNADTWTYTKSDGTLAKSEWMSLDYNGLRYWYYFNDDGNMRTNWFDYNNERFYLMPEKDGWRGRMATGWKNIENKWYYFETVPGSSQGRLYRSTVTPDGHTVGADGAWNGVGETPVGQK